jgi:hypothetical protein
MRKRGLHYSLATSHSVFAMRRAQLFAIALLALAVVSPAYPVQDASKPARPDYNRAASELVTEFFKDWKDGQATHSATHLLGPEVVVTGVSHSRSAKSWNKNLRDWLTEQEKEAPKHLILDSLNADVGLGSLAVVKAQYTGYGIKGKAVFTLSWVDNRWKISSMVLATQFNW